MFCLLSVMSLYNTFYFGKEELKIQRKYYQVDLVFVGCCLCDIIYHVPSHPFQLHICLESSTVLVCGIIISYATLVCIATIWYP